MAELKSETKNQLLALLLTVPQGCSVQELQNDYHNFIGKPLPYRQLGYVSAQEFLTDIPDVVHVMWTHGNKMILRGISNERTAMVNELISQNRPKKKARRGGGRGRGRSAPPGGSYRDRYAPRDPTVPPFMRAQIQELLRGYPNGLLGSMFSEAFARRFGNQLSPQRLGFMTLGDLLRSLADFVQIEEMRGGGFRIFLKKSRASSVTTREKLSANHASRGSSAGAKRLSHQAAEVKGRQAVAPDVRASHPHKHHEVPAVATRGQPSRHPSSDYVDEGDRSSVEDFPDDEDDDGTGINAELKAKIRCVLNTKKSGIWAAQFPAEFKRLHKKELPLKNLGYLSVIEMASSIPDVITIERPTSKGDWMLYDASVRKAKPESAKQQDSSHADQVKFSTAPCLDDILKERIRQVLLTQPGGVVLKDFLNLYKSFTAEDLSFKNLGFASLDALVISLVDDILQMKYEGDGMVKLFPIDLSKPKVNLLVNRPQGSTKRGIPPDAVGPGVGFVPVNPPENIEYLEILVSNVLSPGRFWFQLKGDHTTVALEELMDRLEEVYYGNDGDLYKMPESLIMIGQVCAALFPEDENWHRANITGIPNMDFVEVYYVDYGNTCSVPRSSLRMLKSRFLKLPTQAIRGRLSHILPAQGEVWTRSSSNRLLSLCANRALVALVTNVKDRIFSLCLCDTTTDVDIHINDLLVTEGYAKVQKDDVPPPQSDPNLNNVEQNYLPTPPLATVAPLPPEATNTLLIEPELKPRYIRSIQLTEDYDVHIMNLNRKPYIISGDIAAFFWKKGTLRSMLRQKQLSLPKIILSIEDYPDLFTEIRNYELRGMIENGEVRSHATFYDLSSVLEILRVFEHPSTALVEAMEEQIQCFNPDDGYWHGEEFRASEDEDEEEQSNASSDEQYNLTDLNMSLEVLQFRRKRILQQMLVESSERSVEELHKVELQIQEMRSKVKAQEAREAVKGQDLVSAKRRAADDEEFIQECVMQQYQTTTQSASDAVSMTTSDVNSPHKVTNRVTPMISTSKLSSETPTLSGMATTPAATMDMRSLLDMSSPLPGTTAASQANQSAALPGMAGVMTLEQKQILYQNLLMNPSPIPVLPLNPSLMPLNVPSPAASQPQTLPSQPMIDLSTLSLNVSQAFPLNQFLNPTLPLLSQTQLQEMTSVLGQGRGLSRTAGYVEPNVGITNKSKQPPH